MLNFRIPFLEPEVFGEHDFNLGENLDILTIAENLTEEAKYLIHILKNAEPVDIREQYQIELRKINPHDESCSTYRMSLRVDAVVWFRHHKLKSKDAEKMEKLYEIGSYYVEKVKDETENYPKVENEKDIKRIAIDNSTFDKWCYKDREGKDCPTQTDLRRPCEYGHYKWCDGENLGSNGYCSALSALGGNHKSMCTHFSEMNQSEKPVPYLCRFPSVSINRQNVFCRFYANAHFRIYHGEVLKPLSYPYFIVSARSDATPVITLNPVKHCLNEEYLQKSDAWQAVLLTLIHMKKKLNLEKLPLNRIYVNFGKWMQQKADDPMYRFCHAHINIVLSLETINKINPPYKPNEDRIDRLFKSKDEKKSEKKLFLPLVGSILPPKFHRLDGSRELISYMNDHMMPLVFADNRKLKRTISILKEKLNELEKENEIYRNSLYGSTRDTFEPDDFLPSTETDDIAAGINEKVLLNENCFNKTSE